MPEIKTPLPMSRIRDLYGLATKWQTRPTEKHLVDLQASNLAQFDRALIEHERKIRADERERLARLGEKAVVNGRAERPDDVRADIGDANRMLITGGHVAPMTVRGLLAYIDRLEEAVGDAQRAVRLNLAGAKAEEDRLLDIIEATEDEADRAKKDRDEAMEVVRKVQDLADPNTWGCGNTYVAGNLVVEALGKWGRTDG